MKAELRAGAANMTFKNKVLAMVFEKSSTRTRVSFEAGMAQLGGSSMFLSPRDTQLGRGEPIEDTAQVMSRMVDLITVRTFEHEKLEAFAAHSKVPVINALTDSYHPCQLLADIMTWMEHRGDISGKKVAWIGDGNNMCQSYINAARQFDFQLAIACPEGFAPEPALLTENESRVTLLTDPTEAASGANLVVTDVWSSMGQEEEQNIRESAFSRYQVSEELLDLGSDDVLFMHCLPAHRGEEISETLLNDNRAVVWEEAENRLHAQKALMEFLLQQP
jgi:ornithine carbamoyltransferase